MTEQPRLPLRAERVSDIAKRRRREHFATDDEQAEMIAFYRGVHRRTMRALISWCVSGELRAWESTILERLDLRQSTWYDHRTRLVDDGWLALVEPAKRGKPGVPGSGRRARYVIRTPPERRFALEHAEPLSCPCGAGCKSLAACPGWPPLTLEGLGR